MDPDCIYEICQSQPADQGLPKRYLRGEKSVYKVGNTTFMIIFHSSFVFSVQ